MCYLLSRHIEGVNTQSNMQGRKVLLGIRLTADNGTHEEKVELEELGIVPPHLLSFWENVLHHNTLNTRGRGSVCVIHVGVVECGDLELI
jgi:hypothetical protein